MAFAGAASSQPSDWAQEAVQTAQETSLVPETLTTAYDTAITRAEFCSLAASLYRIWEANGQLKDWNSQENRTPKNRVSSSERCKSEAGAFDQRRQIMLIGGVAPTAVVVSLDPAENELADRLAFHAGAVESVDNLFLQRCEKALHACVVEATMRPPHALPDGTEPGDHRPVLLTGVLAAMVGVQDQTLLITIA